MASLREILAQLINPPPLKKPSLWLVGDSHISSIYFREELNSALLAAGILFDFVGALGMPPNSGTGGNPGNPVLIDWRHSGLSGRRASHLVSGTIATNGLATAAGHTLSAGVPFAFKSLGPQVSGYSTDTLYYARDVSGNNFRGATYQGAAAVSATATATATCTVGLGIAELIPALKAKNHTVPEVSITRIGTNDILADLSADTVFEHILAAYDAVVAAYPKAYHVFVAPPPVVEGTASGVDFADYNAVRDAVVARLKLAMLERGTKVAFLDTAPIIKAHHFDPDGVHLNAHGYAAEAEVVATALKTLLGYQSAEPLPLPFRAVSAQPVLSFPSNGEVEIPYDVSHHPYTFNEDDEAVPAPFMVHVRYRPAALPADSTFRQIVRFGDTHPTGYAIGHYATSGNGGGVSIYLGTSGSPVIAGAAPPAYAAEILKVGTWSDLYVVVDTDAMLVGLFVGNKPDRLRLIQWAPLSAVPTIEEQEATHIGATVFDAAAGEIADFWIAKGVSYNDAYEVAEAHYRTSVLPDEVTAAYPLNDGSGTSPDPAIYGQDAGTASNTTWLAATSDAAVVPGVTSQVSSSSVSENRVRMSTKTVTFDDFDGIAALTTTVAIDPTPMPPGARLIGVSVSRSAAFDDGAAGTLAVEIGIGADPDSIRTSFALDAAGTGFPKSATAGVNGYTGADIGGQSLGLKFTGSANLGTFTAGSATFVLIWAIPDTV